jgi:hypothetical protein
MLFRPLAFAVTAAAALFVIPESVDGLDDIVNALPIDPTTFEVPAHALAQSFDIPCPQCDGDDAHLQMGFAVEDGARLTLNGVELFPNPDPAHADLVAPVVTASGSETRQRLGYSVVISLDGKDEQQMMDLISLQINVIEVGARAVHGIPTINVSLISAATGEVLIGGVQMTSAVEENKCYSPWCQVKNFFSEMRKGFGGFKSCHGRPRPSVTSPEHVTLDGHRQPGSQSGHHHGEYSRHPSFRKLFKGIVTHILLPIIMGVVAGISVAMLSVVICRSISRMISFVRPQQEHRDPAHRCNSPTCCAPAPADPADEEEKIGLMETKDEQEPQDLPPRYEG